MITFCRRILMGSLSLWVCLAVGTRLEADAGAEKIDRLQRSIDGASELGNFSRVQTLRLELAEYSRQINDFATAARQYELLLASRPPRSDRVKYFIQLGNMRYALQDYSGAINSYQDALHDEPRSWEANLALGRAYAQVELDTNAIEVYQRCIVIRPKAHESYEEIAAVYQRQGYLNKAISFYQKALKLEPRPESYLGMADCYARQDDMAHAEAVLQQAKTLVPRSDYDVRLGDIFQKAGNLQRARLAWEEALRSDPKRDDVRLKLVLLYDRLNRRSDADRLFKSLLDSYPQSPLVHFLRAWTFYSRGDRQDSRKEALLTQRLQPTELVQHYNELLLAQLRK